MNDPEQSWKRLVEASRKAPPSGEPEETAPPGFRDRIHGLRNVVETFARALLWRRWSVGLALCCIALFVTVLAITRCGDRKNPLILPPELSSPQP